MSSDQNDFEALRKLMAIKRYELPPPRYFNELSDRVISRLERGEGKSSFWESILQSVVVRPAMAYSCALAALSALTWSVVYSVKNSPAEPTRNFANGWQSGAEAWSTQSAEPMRTSGWMNNLNSSNPVLGSTMMYDLGTHSRVPEKLGTLP